MGKKLIISGYRTENTEVFENISDEKIKLIYKILDSKKKEPLNIISNWMNNFFNNKFFYDIFASLNKRI